LEIIQDKTCKWKRSSKKTSNLNQRMQHGPLNADLTIKGIGEQ